MYFILKLSSVYLFPLFSLPEQAMNEFGPAFVINPDTVSLTPGGQIEFGHVQRVQQYANYMSPETEEGFVMTATAVEQVMRKYFLTHKSPRKQTTKLCLQN